MIKHYLIFTTFAISLLLFVLFNILTQNKKELHSQQLALTGLTTIVEPALSSSTLEDRFLYLTKSINRIYPLMPKIEKKGFVYAK